MAKTFKLALNAGHGMHTEGKRCMKSLDPSETREWWLNQRVANYVQEAAKQYDGFGVLRTDDTTGAEDVRLSTRCAAANNYGANLYLSLHHNAGINGGRGGGVVAYCARGSTIGAPWRDALYAAVVGAGGLAGNRAEPRTEKNFDELVGTSMAAVLIECGFMDSSTDVPIILSESYSKAIGYAIAECIASRVGLAKKVQASQSQAHAVTAEQVQQIAKGEAGNAVSNLMSSAKTGDKHNAYAEAAANWANDNGLIQGDGNGNYAWTKPMTRQEMVTLLYRYHQWANK